MNEKSKNLWLAGIPAWALSVFTLTILFVLVFILKSFELIDFIVIEIGLYVFYALFLPIACFIICKTHPKSQYKYMVPDYKEIIVVDDYTLRFVTQEPTPETLTMIESISMVPPKYFKEWDEKDYAYLTRTPVGTGPYKFIEWVKDSHIKMVANPALTGFTAPKILWLRNHEPRNFDRTTKVLLPKDEIRRRLTGEFATEVSDASGMLLLDVVRRKWSGSLM